MILSILIKRTLALVLLAGLVSTLAGCGQDEFAKNDTRSKAPLGKVTIAGQQFTEAAIMTSLYEQVLQHAGYSVSVKNFATRDVYLPALQQGEVQVSADYLASMTEALNRKDNGPQAVAVSSPDTEATLAKLAELAAPRGLQPLEPAEAKNVNSYAVTKKFAQTHRLKTLSDLGEMGQPVILAANSDCSERQDCALGLESVYGIRISRIEPLGFDSAETKRALTSNEVQLGQVASTDGGLASMGIVILEDDKSWQNAENLVPVVNSAWIKDNPKAVKVLNELSAALTTEDLATMNQQVDAQRLKPADVARDFLTEHDLI